jgi:predicted glycosyltransferase
MFWFDLDNSPHVPLFRPIFYELEKRNKNYFITARDYAQTKDLLTLWNVPHTLIGKHGGKNKIKKIINLFSRSNELIKNVKDRQINLAISHGSRTQVVTAKWLNIPSVLMLDYEYTEARIFNMLATYLLIPSLITDKRLYDAGFNLRKVVRYDGFKEEIYLGNFFPEKNFRKSIGIDEQTILVTMRPPAMSANYHNKKSEELFQKCLEYFSENTNSQCLIVARDTKKVNIIPNFLKKRENISFLKQAVDGLQLIWNSDIVVSGGGTMSRESALLGVPTFSIFAGQKPYLDEYLQEKGKLEFIENFKQIESIKIEKRRIGENYKSKNGELASQITDIIVDLT